MNRNWAVGCVIAVICLLPLRVQGQSGVKSVEQFNSNGMDFILAEDHSIPNVGIGLNIRTGGIDDPPGKEGLSQLTMDMLTRGTAKRSRHEITEAVEYLGASLSGSVGSISAEIGGETLSRFLESYMEIFGDVVLNPVFKESEFETLKKETADLLRLSLNNDSALGRRHFMKLVYGDHPYGRPTDGTLKSLANITIADVKERYQQIMRKGLISFYAAGDMDRATLLRISQQYLGGLKDGTAEPTSVGKPPRLQRRNLVIVDKPDRSQIQLFIGHPSIAAKEKAYYPLTVGNTAFGGYFSSRYNDEIRVKRGWTYSASTNLLLNREAGVFVMRTFTAEKNLGPVIRKSLEMLQEFSEQGLTSAELAKAKSNIINEYPFMLDTADKRVDEVLRMRNLDLPKDYLTKFQSHMEAVSEDQVRRATREHIDAKNVAIVAVCEAKRCRKLLEEAIEGLASVQVVPYDSL